LGIVDASSPIAVRLKVYNKLVAISLLTYLAFIPLTGIIGSLTYFFIIAFSSIILLLCLYLNSIRTHTLSKVLFLATLITSIYLISAHLGDETAVFLCLIPISTLPLLFYKNALNAVFTLLMCILTFVLLQTDFKPLEQFNAVTWKSMLLYNSIVFGVLVIGYYYNIFFKISTEEKDEKLILVNKDISKRNEKILENIYLARNIQANLLPYDSYFKELFPKSFVFYQPRDLVSGDFYWIENRDEISYCAVIDCTGHGVPGAFVSILGHQGLNRCVNDLKLSEPEDILNKLHEMMFQVLRKEDSLILDGMDMSLVSYNKKTNSISYSGAQNSLLLVRRNEFDLEEQEAEYRGLNHSLFKIQAQRQSVGSEYLKEPFVQKDISLKDGDALYFYTDGYIDQFGGPHHKKLMHKQFKKLLLSIQEFEPDNQLAQLRSYYENWKGDWKQTDDICVIGLNFDERV
jgi:serine phosphatase RsbU (regulator of sigma subunit)